MAPIFSRKCDVFQRFPTRIPPRFHQKCGGTKRRRLPRTPDPRNPALPGVLLDFCELPLGVGQESRWSRSTFDATPWGCQGVGYVGCHHLISSWLHGKKSIPLFTTHCHLNKKTPANKLPLFLFVWKFCSPKMPRCQRIKRSSSWIKRA